MKAMFSTWSVMAALAITIVSAQIPEFEENADVSVSLLQLNANFAHRSTVDRGASKTKILSSLTQDDITIGVLTMSMARSVEHQNLSLSVALGIDKNSMYLPASYISLYESVGARVVPIRFDLPEPALKSLFQQIALSGDGKRLAVASIQDDDSKGIVRIYDFDGDDWVLNPTSPKGEKNGDLFGIAIDINQDGSKVVVVYNAQSPFDSTLEYIQVFAIDSLNNWILWGDLIQRNPPNPAFYTNSISLSDDGEVLAVTFGPVGNELSKTMVFDFSPNQKWIPRDNDLVGDGVSLAGDGNNVVVTTYSDKTSTAYKWRSDSWIQMGWTFPGIAKVESTSGVSMSTDGTRFMISEHLTMNPNVGLRSRVRLFHYG